MLKKISVLYITIVCFFIVSIGYSQAIDVWKVKTQRSLLKSNMNFQIPIYELNIDALKTVLSKTPKRNISNRSSKVLLNFPMYDGKMESFEIFEHSVLSEKLAEKYPSIKSYYAKAVNNPLHIIRFSVDTFGFHAMIFSENGSYYINPVKNTAKDYFIASKKDFESKQFICLAKDNELGNIEKEIAVVQKRTVDDGLLRTYRLALACTGEYATFHINEAGLSGGTDIQKKGAVLSAMNVAMTRVNGIFERDLSITMEIVPNNDDIIFLDADTDGYTNSDGDSMLDENQEIVDDIIGAENYDIGHVFSTGGGGIAILNSPCVSAWKAGGVTGSPFPVGDPFHVDFVSHEMGHQYGAHHTQNNNCSRNNSTAVEPGSGSTIMGYAGICSPNIQNNSDAYFHAISLAEIWQNITSGNSTCANTQNTGNNPPIVEGGNDYVIPQGTSFVLEATGSDIDGDVITYSWEQIDNQIGVMPPVSDAIGGPIFRSLLPSNLPSRYFPNTTDLLNDNLSPTWEVIPTVARNLNFSVVARDNNILGGQTARDDVEIVVDGSSGPFQITSHSVPETLNVGQITTVNWDIANTNTTPINTSLVNIYLIIDEDFENLILVAENVTNDGAHNIVIPSDLDTSTARIMVKAVDNVYFAINSGNLSIQQSEFVLDFSEIEFSVCQPENVTFNFTYNTFVGFVETVAFTSTNVPSGLNVSFNPTMASNDDTQVEVTITGTNAASIGDSDFSIVASSISLTKDFPINLNVFSSTISSPTLLSPVNNSIDIPLDQVLLWNNDINTQQYELEISEELNFSSVLETYTGSLVGYSPSILQSDTQYYWRVKSINDCNESVFSTPFTFTTSRINCLDEFVNNQTIQIDDENPNTVSSTINVTEAGLLQDISVNLNISHTFVSDLTINLMSPSGTTITLLSEACDSGMNINATFSDQGSNLFCDVNPAVSNNVSPLQQLSTFDNEQIFGTWTLTIIDNYNGDGGAINSFGLDFCVKDFYDINIEHESCREFNDGSISIATESVVEHTAVLTGVINASNTFTDNTSFTGLSAGNYNVCITRNDISNAEQCFDFTIMEPDIFTVQSSLNTDLNTVDLNLEGAEIYDIELNGVLSQISENTTSLQLANGFNSLVISTGINCHEPYLENFLVGDNTVVYPSPFESEITLFVIDANKLVSVSVHSVAGELIMSNELRSNERGEIYIQFGHLSSGVYIVNIEWSNEKSIHKIIRM